MATMNALDELSRMAGSSVTNVGAGPGSNLPRNRSFKELRAASEILGVGGGLQDGAVSTVTRPPFTAISNPFLSNIPSLRSTSSAASKPTGGEPGKARTWEERIDEHVQKLFSKYSRMEQDESRRIVDEMYEKRAQETHDARMKLYVAELHGNRTLGGSLKTTTAALPSVTGPAAVIIDAKDLDPTIVGQYLDVVYRWNRNRQAPFDNVLVAFQNLASKADLSAWKLLSAMIARNEVGALSFHCHQFQQIVNGTVREAIRNGHDLSTPYSLTQGMAPAVASYVKLKTNNTSSPWPIVYYCLRCGDASAALQVLDATNTQVDDPSVRQIVSSFSQAQGSLPCVWDASVPPAVSSSVRRALVALYDRTKHLHSTDQYHVATLALLSASDLDAVLGSPVVRTGEDYVFGGLWYALQQNYPPTAIEQLANNIKDLGASSFADENAWGYALPLMAVQQYREALTHVAKTNLLQATHMAMMLDAANVKWKEVGSTQATTASSLATTLLVDYANKLQQKDAFAAVEYLVRIPNERKARMEVARVVVESQQPDAFVTYLQQLFLDRTSSVVVEAAELARSRGHADLAAHLFWRVERFDLLLSLLNDQLASEMADGTNQIEWREKALSFRHEILADNKDLVMKRMLEASNTTDRLETFEMLMELNQAFHFAKAKDYERAWACIDKLPLLPKNKEECSAKARQYASLNPALKKVFPMVLETSMEALSQIYAQLKSASHGQQTSQQLQLQLRNSAQLLVYDFACELQSEIPPGTYARMTTMERSMK